MQKHHKPTKRFARQAAPTKENITTGMAHCLMVMQPYVHRTCDHCAFVAEGRHREHHRVTDKRASPQSTH